MICYSIVSGIVMSTRPQNLHASDLPRRYYFRITSRRLPNQWISGINALDNFGFVSLKDVRVRKQSVRSGRLGTKDVGECRLDGVRVAASTEEGVDLAASERAQ
jgi:hypothetical protein